MIQHDQIIHYCKKNHGITREEADMHLGIGSLSRRICDLKERGYKIKKITEYGINRHTGAPTHWTRYFIIGEIL